MPLVPTAIKAKFKDRIFQGLKREFSPEASKAGGYQPLAEDMLLRLANAISDIAIDLVEEIKTNAQVVPGQAVAGSSPSGPVVGATSAPGKII